MASGTAARCARNPFYVLGLPVDCTRAQVERAGQKLLAMLELDLADAGEYQTPVGIHRRSADGIRAALAELRDPDRRILHELWVREPTAGTPSPDSVQSASDGDPLAAFPALDLLAWAQPRGPSDRGKR